VRETFTSHRLSHLSQLRRNPGSFCPSPFVAPPIPCTLVLNSGFGSLSQVRDRWSLECKSQVWAALLISPRRAVTCFTASRPLSPPHPAPPPQGDKQAVGWGGVEQKLYFYKLLSLFSYLASGGGKHLHNASINAQPFLQFSPPRFLFLFLNLLKNKNKNKKSPPSQEFISPTPPPLWGGPGPRGVYLPPPPSYLFPGGLGDFACAFYFDF